MHRLFLHRGALVTIAALPLPVIHAQIAPPPASSAQSTAAMSWHGRYTNNSLTLELKASDAGTVSGTLHFDGQAHRVVVHPIGNKLYGEVQINTDATTFGGSGVGNMGSVETTPVRAHRRDMSINVTVPPLGALFLRRQS